MRRALGLFAILVVAGSFPGCSCNNSPSHNGGQDMSAALDGSTDAKKGDGGPACLGAGATCASNGQCCTDLCDATSHLCVTKMCGNAGASCVNASDCCGLACVNNQCNGSMQCISDGQSCTSGASCCSTICGSNNTCTALNTCKTAGNACAIDGDCCSGTCLNHQCAAPSQISYCTQVGDICMSDGECCTGVCNLLSGQSVGTCAAITTSCNIDGTTCNGCGTCCSHFCGPYGLGGASICQPASGCHVQGDLCHVDSDCCGGDSTSGLPGAGLVQCVPDPLYGNKIGTCGGPSAGNCPPGVSTCSHTCDPEGNVCHLNPTPVCLGGNTNFRADCCACISSKTCCQPDKTGIPRCNAVVTPTDGGTTCVPANGFCAFSGDCCDGLPCVPNAQGQLVCGAMCSPSGGPCTTNSDCCTGLSCYVPPGALKGSCTSPPPPPPPPADMGPVDMAGTKPVDMAGQVCATYGQACSTSVPCCNAPCLTPITATSGGTQCIPTDTNCICFQIL
jgi:hypothetical protein